MEPKFQQQKSKIFNVMDRPHPTPPNHQNITDPEKLETLLSRQFQQLINQHPTFNIDQVFYLQASRLYTEILHKKKQVEKVEKEVYQMSQKLGVQTKISRNHSANPESNSGYQNGQEKKKRVRRTAEEIARHYTCMINNCYKSYGSEGSLNQHIRSKHRTQCGQTLMTLNLSHPNSQ